MNLATLPVIGSLLIAGAAASLAASKSVIPAMVPDYLVTEEPYRFNGAVTSGESRGSGFCAWDKRAFFSAAHVVFDDENLLWKTPPKWYGQTHALKLDRTKAIQSRGYYRWTDYSEIVTEQGSSGEAFGRDVILGFAFTDLIGGTPATLNMKGFDDLRRPVKSMMTGYPARIAYTDKPLGGYFMYRTGPTLNLYETYEGKAVETTLISSGPGNSGGPIWTQSGRSGWTAAGVVVGGLPSESIVYAFSSEADALLRAVSPIVKSAVPQSINMNGVSATSRFFSSNRQQRLPDGVHTWTDYPLAVSGFPTDAIVKAVRISVKVKTTHQGDLQILLTAPGGYGHLIHNEEGAGAQNLVIENRNVTEPFLDIPVAGRWTVRFQDRLKGDICTVQSVVLDIVAESTETPATDP